MTTSAAKTLDLLKLIGVDRVCDLSDLIQTTGWPRSSVLRFLGILIDAGLVQRVRPGQYDVTLTTWRIGSSAVQYRNMRNRVAPLLQVLVEQTKETAQYAQYQNGQTVYIEFLPGLHAVHMVQPIGESAPAYCTSTGRAQLAWKSEEEIRHAIEGAEPHTSATKTSSEELLIALDEVRNSGVSINRGEWRTDVWGVASPIFDHTGQVVGALSVAGPKDRMKDNLDHCINAVRSAAEQLSMSPAPVRKGDRGYAHR